MDTQPAAATYDKAARTKAGIMQAALKLFSRHGFEGTSVAMIARGAGVSQGLLYNYFDGKEGLLKAIFEESMRDVRDSFALADHAATPDQRIAALVRGAFEILRRKLDFWRLTYALRMQSRILATLGGPLPAWTAEVRATLTTYMRDAGASHPEVEAELLFALIDGASQHFALEPNRYPLDAIADRIIARYTRASSEHT